MIWTFVIQQYYVWTKIRIMFNGKNLVWICLGPKLKKIVYLVLESCEDGTNFINNEESIYENFVYAN